jgi:hypothetical protein
MHCFGYKIYPEFRVKNLPKTGYKAGYKNVNFVYFVGFKIHKIDKTL